MESITVFVLFVELFAGVIQWTPDGLGVIHGVSVQYEYIGNGKIKFSPDTFETYEECKRIEQAVLKQFVGVVKAAGCVKRKQEK